MIKPFTCDQTIHSWPNGPSVTKPFSHNCSSVTKNNNTAGPVLLWHFLGPLYDCNTSKGLFMTLTLPGASLWLWNLLVPLCDCGTSWSLFMIVILPVPHYDCDTSCASLWSWYFLCLFLIVSHFFLVYNLFYCLFCHLSLLREIW